MDFIFPGMGKYFNKRVNALFANVKKLQQNKNGE
jgi:hypothetical protein